MLSLLGQRYVVALSLVNRRTLFCKFTTRNTLLVCRNEVWVKVEWLCALFIVALLLITSSNDTQQRRISGSCNGLSDGRSVKVAQWSWTSNIKQKREISHLTAWAGRKMLMMRKHSNDSITQNFFFSCARFCISRKKFFRTTSNYGTEMPRQCAISERY